MVRLMSFCLIAFSLFHAANAWKTDRKPRVFGDKIPRRALVTRIRRVQKNIVLYHNFFRTRVTPPAADMLSMTWNKDAARAAQNWAEQCMLLTHDNVTGRWVDNYGSCGQNIFISTHQVPWFWELLGETGTSIQEGSTLLYVLQALPPQEAVHQCLPFRRSVGQLQ
ncbi:hypothetical protein C0J52_00391 [Blattella germanica]|nr:hypothetical protein C0J52_00391 [Blattella germanica]